MKSAPMRAPNTMLLSRSAAMGAISLAAYSSAPEVWAHSTIE